MDGEQSRAQPSPSGTNQLQRCLRLTEDHQSKTIKLNPIVPLGLGNFLGTGGQGVGPGTRSLKSLCLSLKCLHLTPLTSLVLSFHPLIPPILSRHQPIIAIKMDFTDFCQGQALRWGSREGFRKAC